MARGRRVLALQGEVAEQRARVVALEQQLARAIRDERSRGGAMGEGGGTVARRAAVTSGEKHSAIGGASASAIASGEKYGASGEKCVAVLSSSSPPSQSPSVQRPKRLRGASLLNPRAKR